MLKRIRGLFESIEEKFRGSHTSHEFIDADGGEQLIATLQRAVGQVTRTVWYDLHPCVSKILLPAFPCVTVPAAHHSGRCGNKLCLQKSQLVEHGTRMLRRGTRLWAYAVREGYS